MKKRTCKPNLTYHTYSRCADKALLMKPERMKKLMITVLNMALDKYNFHLSTYVIMDNHFHFIIKTLKDGPSISIIMQFIKAQYARRYNKITGRTGPFWNERFGDTIIEETEDPDSAFIYINNYIMNNPVRAQYVTEAKNYQYCSIKFYIDQKYYPPVKLTFSDYFLKLGNDFSERRKKYLEFQDIFK